MLYELCSFCNSPFLFWTVLITILYGGALMSIVLAIGIFLFSYFFIITEKIPRSIVAVFGATLLIVFGVLDQLFITLIGIPSDF